ncbi:hypothetical protein FRC20_001275 [Serendipita sp. 405]|nr:hypothetical protein FRC15_001845 [Serendipita sp. 397]KAG8869527.1 hypothetical protein FRC20_001275 [Serendipita sp. 405]
MTPLPPPPPIPFRTPGPSILKHPPPPQPKFFSLSTIKTFLPNQMQSPSSPNVYDDGGKGIRGTALKRAHFILPSLSTTYPIWSGNPPASPSLEREKADIEERERMKRARLVRGNSVTSLRSLSLHSPSTTEEFWSLEKVEQFYKECCLGRDEPIDLRIVSAIKAAGSTPRSLQLSNVTLDIHSAMALSDCLTIEWGLRKLVLKDCELEDLGLKALLHSILIPNSLSYLSLASNKSLRSSSWKLVGIYLSKAVSLQFLDLSLNPLDKRAVEYIAGALGTIPPSMPSSKPGSVVSTPTLEVAEPRFQVSDKPQLVSLRMDGCNLRPAALEALAHSVRSAPLQHISLRNNYIAPSGAVALALMIKDYPDTVSNPLNGNASAPSSPSLQSTPLSPPSTPRATNLNAALAVRQVAIPPPPTPQPQVAGTTYTPYIPRSKRASVLSVVNAPASPGVDREERQVPRFSTSQGGGITTRHLPPQTPGEVVSAATAAARSAGPSLALLDKVRALDNLPRLGALKTLDLRGNDLRNGVSSISQVLKRNRTLKILNLAENKIGVDGLVSVADALKYNNSLETLDLSRNPCCGPGVEGITSLRTAFTLNTSLKRLFLSSTSLTSEGAIMLAEFLPESSSLLHLDLTQNPLDIAGVMALSNGLKANEVMRCLDLNIPPSDEEMARLCREILNWCVRNTERADARARSEGAHPRGKGIWAMIEDSALARDVRKGEGRRIEIDTLAGAQELQAQLEMILQSDKGNPIIPLAEEIILLDRAKATLPSLVAAIEASNDPNKLEEMLILNDSLTDMIKRMESRRPLRPSLSLNGIINGNSRHLDTTGSAPGTPAFSPGIRSPLSQSFSSFSSITPSIGAEDDGPVTPRLDKGKGKAIHDDDFTIGVGEDGKIIPEPGSATADDTLGSPTDSRSRIWVEEEGEVFRKGVALLTPEKMEGELGDFAGDDLRIELLETEVERPPARMLDVDEDGDPIPEHQQLLAPPIPRIPKTV